MEIKNDTPLNKLGLSQRALNSLARDNRFTVGDILDLTYDDIIKLRNIGEKTIKEIVDLRDSVKSGELKKVESPTLVNIIDPRSMNEEYAEILFKGDDGFLHKDLSVTILSLTTAKIGSLLRGGFDTLRKLAEAEEISVKNLKSLGSGIENVKNELSKRIVVLYPEKHSADKVYKISQIIGQEYIDDESIFDLIENAIRAYLYTYDGEITLEDENGYTENRALLSSIYKNGLVCDLTGEYILNLLDDNVLDYAQIKNKAPKSLLYSYRLDDLLLFMKSKNLIEESEEGYQRFLPCLLDWIETGLKKDTEKDIIRKRVMGMTLEEIGSEYGITRERIRQIESAAKRKFVHFKEERYVYWVNKYDFTQEQFSTLFGVPVSSYNSALYLAGSSSNKKLSILEILDDENLTYAMSKRLRVGLSDKYVLLFDEFVPIKERKILEKIIEWKYSEEPVRIEYLLKEYNVLIDEYKLNLDKLAEDEDRRVESLVSRFRHAIKREKRSYRFYKYEDYDFDEFFKKIDFNMFMDTEISVQKIMLLYPELMQEYDIRACYELHSIFSKYEDKLSKYGVTREVAPNIIVGKAVREIQVKSFIYKLAPISLDDFCKAYEEEYGVEAPTVRGTYYEFFHPYVKEDKILDVTQEPMREDELFKMKSSMISDFYFIEDVEKLYKKLYPNGNMEKINYYNLKKLGFNIYSTFIARNTHKNLEECLMKTIMDNDGIDPETMDRRFYSVQFYYFAKTRLRENFDIIEMAEGKFITFDAFHEKYPSVTKEQLADFAKKAVEFAPKDIFTMISLRKAGFKHNLDDINESDRFYSGLIRSLRLAYSSRNDGDLFFSKTDKAIERKTFFKEVLKDIKDDCIKASDLSNYILDEYGIFFERYEIARFTRESGYFYSVDDKTVYFSEEEYINSLS